MIAANELRIGSTILINNKEKEPYYHNVSAHDIEEISECGNDCYPIQLTPEILDKCGFETPDEYRETVKYKDRVIIDLHMGKYLLRDNHYIELKSLHQLQNLYFALTGAELNYTP